ncbi:hypothetical protein [Kitasatospora sp. GP82]|uniref:hypothetical protein n=1 Tax=Kitasatospora sp. GP82 TaxID=3035089 RepID=UPI002475D95B|nr:hypothetical protein [Kitasatospora sp. GP82]MDH6129377.1 hypothetical protein [Kitasatospora sp. GP82]
MVPLVTFNTGRVIDRGQMAAERFGLHQPNWPEVRAALERPGLRSQTLAASLKLLAAAADLDSITGFHRVHERLRAVFLAERRLASLLRLRALMVLRHGRPGVVANTQLHRFIRHLEDYGTDLISNRRDEGIAGNARLALGMVHHLLSSSDLPA